MNSNKLRVVIDTNILLVSVSSKSQYHRIFRKIPDGEPDVFVTNEILTEYEEIIASKYNQAMSKDVVRALMKLPNVHRQEIYYKWNLIYEDPDDNKFADCAVSANADYLVSNDKHFHVLAKIRFPKIRVIPIKLFEKILFEGI
ncbi:MAG: putative toxin-antitoxin system toxin component, PIN family [Desulfococcaceae bacterium]|jgi:putative PIN family toxin of toxin-antitoxin system|nr:putative toxin-antitoxin system toxin component, PIN family [Desulfococcaceae bacterium]